VELDGDMLVILSRAKQVDGIRIYSHMKEKFVAGEY